MIIAVCIIGSAVGLIVLAVRLREACEELNRVRRERDTYDRAIQASPLKTAAVGERTALPADGLAGW